MNQQFHSQEAIPRCMDKDVFHSIVYLCENLNIELLIMNELQLTRERHEFELCGFVHIFFSFFLNMHYSTTRPQLAESSDMEEGWL